jgi:hypothetical protein
MAKTAKTSVEFLHADDLAARVAGAGASWVDVLGLIQKYGALAIAVIEAVLPLLKSGPNGGPDYPGIIKVVEQYGPQVVKAVLSLFGITVP